MCWQDPKEEEDYDKKIAQSYSSEKEKEIFS